MDTEKNNGAKKQKGNLTDDKRAQNREVNPVTNVKLPEQRKTDSTVDLKEQKRRLKDQARADEV